MSIAKLNAGTSESHGETRRQRLHLQLRSAHFTLANEFELIAAYII